mgnify:FL=1
MENKLEKIITNSLTINKEIITKEKIKIIIDELYKAILDNKDSLLSANKIDIETANGFELNFAIVEQIFKNIEKETIYCGDTIYSQKNNEKNFMYGKYYSSRGTILVINEGNTYILLELILKNLIACNVLIINTSGYMYGTNNFIIHILQTILEHNNYSKNQVQIYVSETSEEILKQYTSLDLVVCIGDHNLQRFVENHCQNELIVSGYENFDIYLETDKYTNLINEIIKQNVSIQFYINKKLNIDYQNAIIVKDIDEAISQINFNGSRYATAIFTDDKESILYFIKNIKSKIQTINTSPTIERICDINTKDLMIEKTIIYPLFKFSDTLKFEIDEK